jgi:hypothetical protein
MKLQRVGHPDPSLFGPGWLPRLPFKAGITW